MFRPPKWRHKPSRFSLGHSYLPAPVWLGPPIEFMLSNSMLFRDTNWTQDRISSLLLVVHGGCRMELWRCDVLLSLDHCRTGMGREGYKRRVELCLRSCLFDHLVHVYFKSSPTRIPIILNSFNKKCASLSMCLDCWALRVWLWVSAQL